MHNKWKFWLRGAHQMRDDILASLKDDDLGFSPGGDNPTLGKLLTELVDTEQSYVDSLRDLQQVFQPTEIDADPTLADLGRRFAELDREFADLYADWAEDDFQATVSRPGGFEVSRSDQFDIYVQAVLIVLAKSVVYLRAMSREVPDSAADWIG